MLQEIPEIYFYIVPVGDHFHIKYQEYFALEREKKNILSLPNAYPFVTEKIFGK